jgi:hypothetical protein
MDRRAGSDDMQAEYEQDRRDANADAMAEPDVEICEWYALCDNPAEGEVHHPILGYVPTCGRCAAKHNLELRPL